MKKISQIIILSLGGLVIGGAVLAANYRSVPVDSSNNGNWAQNFNIGGSVSASGTATFAATSTFQANVIVVPTSTFLATDSTGKIIATGTPAGGAGGGGITTSSQGSYKPLNVALFLNSSTAIAYDNLTYASGTASGTLTVVGTSTVGNLVVNSVASALGLFNASGTLTAYGGASACSAGQAVTTISAVGGTTCSSFMLGSNNLNELTNTSTARTNLGLGDSATLASSTWFKVANNLNESTNTSTLRTNIGYSGGTGVSIASNGVITNTGVTSLGGATGTILVGAYLSGGLTLTVSSTLPSSTWGSFSVQTSTGWSVPIKIKSNVKRTLAQFSCDDNVGTSTFTLTRYDTLATTTVATNILVGFPCGVAGGSTTTFVSSTIPVGSFLGVTSTVAGTPYISNGYLESTKL